MSEVRHVAKAIYHATPRNKPYGLLAPPHRRYWEKRAEAAILAMREFAAPTVGTAAGAPDPAPAPFKGTIADIWVNGTRSDT